MCTHLAFEVGSLDRLRAERQIVELHGDAFREDGEISTFDDGAKLVAELGTREAVCDDALADLQLLRHNYSDEDLNGLALRCM